MRKVGIINIIQTVFKNFEKDCLDQKIKRQHQEKNQVFKVVDILIFVRLKGKKAGAEPYNNIYYQKLLLG